MRSGLFAHPAFDHFLHCEGSNVIGILLRAKACIVAKLLGKLVRDARAARR